MTTSAPQIRAAIAGNVSHARHARNLSLRALAELSGVSKALLSQLERGVANPTVDVLTAVAAALALEVTDLLRTPLYEPVVRRASAVDDDGPAIAATLFSSPDRRRFEIYEAAIPAGQSRDSAPHGRGSEEFAYVLSGLVTLEIATWSVRLKAGDSVRFSGEAEHSYVAGGRPARLLTLLSMPAE